jgi:hypothetical protein
VDVKNALAQCVLASSLIVKLAIAESPGTTARLAAPPSLDVNYAFQDFAHAPTIAQNEAAAAEQQSSVGPTLGEAMSNFDGECPPCYCPSCECPETPKACEECPRVNNINPAWSIKIGGTVSLDALYNSARPVAPGTPFFLSPKGPFADDTFDIHARETTMYLAGSGPKIGDYETGALIMFALYNDSITVDRYGFLPFQAFGELKNEDWRFAGGLQVDIFAPVLPTVLPFSFLAGSGNAGIYRGQVRAERFWHPASDRQITFTFGISDANPTILNNDVLSEDNGWPNVEMRAAWAAGPLKQQGLAAVRPFEIGVSSVVGQVRSTDLGPLTRVVADVWGLAGDFRWRVNEHWGFQGEVFTGQGLGTYGGDVLQTVNSTTFEAIAGTGGWIEVYFYCTPCVHSHWGYGIDDPVNADVAATQVNFNDTIFANIIWDVTQSFRLASEFTYRTTDYLALPGNEGFGLQWQMQWKF